MNPAMTLSIILIFLGAAGFFRLHIFCMRCLFCWQEKISIYLFF